MKFYFYPDFLFLSSVLYFALLDSTDDDKIVSYHWDVVSGPLQDKSITGETAILKLTDLVPGNYTLK
jgi:hypothetical protein